MRALTATRPHLSTPVESSKLLVQPSFIPDPRSTDVDRISDPESQLPHMLPSERQFAAAADALGVSPDDRLVIYDNQVGW